MAVAPPHQVWRPSGLSDYLDDYSGTVGVADVASLHDQLIANLRLHDRPPLPLADLINLMTASLGSHEPSW
jgi:hypothetical protein